MCLIIDANVVSDLDPPSADAKPVVDSIKQRKILLVIGGKNTEELSANRNVGQWLKGLARANLVRSIPQPDIEREEQILLRRGQHRSDDVHILALARSSGARLLFSLDNALGRDFKTCLDQPRAAVYKRSSHAHLLRSAVCRRQQS